MQAHHHDVPASVIKSLCLTKILAAKIVIL